MQQGFTVWFTGLSGAGKSTLGRRLEAALAGRGLRVELLDGDAVRADLSKELGFSKKDRDTNVRRIGFVTDLLSRNGVIAIAAAISPYRGARDEVRWSHRAPFVEVYVDCPLDELLRRDTKGLYAKALRGEVQDFTGISAPYEPPEAPDLHIRTDLQTIEAAESTILRWLESHDLVRSERSGRE